MLPLTLDGIKAEKERLTQLRGQVKSPSIRAYLYGRICVLEELTEKAATDPDWLNTINNQLIITLK